MPFTFPDPQDTAEFTAENGITYAWDVEDSKWQVKTYKAEDEISFLKNEIIDLQKQIDELAGIVKGNVARYVVDNNNGTPVSRPGQLSSNNPFWSNVKQLSFGTQDADNVPTKPMNADDIIDIVDVTSNKSSRYKVIDASGAPTLVSVEYVSGNADFAPTQEKRVYIY